ncbi:MAG: flagellar hook-associated protein FlgK [Myxococcales bacterium]|nr:flagellar hook-associated protein FlgK [Myxococcales bacterium]
MRWSLNALLSTGANAMSSQRTMLGVYGKNITNASTPGYSRERAIQTDMGWGLGSQIVGIDSLRDTTLQKSLLGSAQSFGFESARSRALQVAEPVVNGLDGSGLQQTLEKFFGALQSASANPSGLSEREVVLAEARALARSLNDAARGLEDARQAAADGAAQTIQTINAIANEVAGLNQQIRDIQGTGEPGHELVDQRDQLLAQLGQLADIDVVPVDGLITVTLGSGQPLVDGTSASRLSMTGGGSAPIGLQLTRASGFAQDVPSPERIGGQLGGAIDARDVTLTQSLAQLDDMAFGLAESMNAIHSSAIDLDGGTGSRFFDIPADAKGAALAIAVSADIVDRPKSLAFASDVANGPGDNTALLALIGLRDLGLGASGLTPSQGLDAVTSKIASALSAADTEARASEARFEDVKAQVASRSGVSLQEEMVALTEAQRAFEASSKVIQTAEELFDAVLRLV